MLSLGYGANSRAVRFLDKAFGIPAQDNPLNY
jgi:hypothetical protein